MLLILWDNNSSEILLSFLINLFLIKIKLIMKNELYILNIVINRVWKINVFRSGYSIGVSTRALHARNPSAKLGTRIF